MVLGRKTNFFLGKTKKKQKKHLLGNYAAKLQKDGFLVFRKKLVFLPKTIFFLGKSWFWTEKPSEKVGFGQKNQLFPRSKNFFLKNGFRQENLPKTTFS